MTTASLRHWLSRGELDKLENVVLEGKGSRLLGEQSPDLRTRVFLKGLPNYLTKISQIHDAVVRGSLMEVQKLVESEPKKKLYFAKDCGGTPLIHKAVYFDHQNILEWIVDNYPVTVEQKDREGRTCLHYCAACRDPEAVWDILIEAGCDASTCDRRGNPAAYYLQRGFEIELPDPERMGSRRLCLKDSSRWNNNLDFKPSNIRIWIHNQDIGKLQQVLWEGHGLKLRCETSNNVRVKRFLEAVPYIMGTIKDIHTATIKNDIDGFRSKIEEPVSSIILSSKDSNGLNVLHKAAGFGYVELAQEILSKYPAIVNAQDNDGKTPLHYAAVCKDGGIMYNMLLKHGADETKPDNRQKTASFYRSHPSDIDMTSLVIVPDAPRVSSTSYPRNWDWRILQTDQSVTRIKPSVSNEENDSTFGSGELTKLAEDADSTEIDNAEDNMNDEKAAEEDNDALDEEKPEIKNEEPDEDEILEVNEDNENPEIENFENEKEDKKINADSNNNEEEKEELDKENNNEEEKEELDTEINNEEEKEELDTEINNEEEKEELDKEINDEEIKIETENASDPEKIENEQPEIEDESEKLELDDEKENKLDNEDDNEKTTDPSATDSGVGETPNDEEQVIISELEDKSVKDNKKISTERKRRDAVWQGENDKDVDVDGMAVDEEAAELVENGNMEQLAALVLRGDGYRIVGRHSSNPELQSFIDNVPAYMAKIRAIHKAAREGNLKELQISLDRRKFAIAKDLSSPHGATPLHVAIIFGSTPIVRYLAGRFPETLHALDLDGRTPLHYAATLADNGHYYNLLLHLGANPLVQDNFGQKSDYYKRNQDDLSHKQLLRDFGAPESLAEEMLTDKVPGVDTVSGRRDVTEPETLATLERAFRLLTSEIGGGGVGSRRSSLPMTPNGSHNSTFGTLLGRCLRRSVFEAIKHRVTCMDHNLFDVIWPALKKYSNAYASNSSLDSGNINVRERRLSISSYDEDFTGNVIAPDFESYTVFSELLEPLVRNLHCLTATGELPMQPPTRFFLNGDRLARTGTGDKETLEKHDLDPSGRYIMMSTVECTRNIDGHQLPLTMKISELEEIENVLTGVLMGPELRVILAEDLNADEPGTYFTVSELLDLFSEVRARMASSGLLSPLIESESSDERRLHGTHWPYGRGVYINSAENLAVWVNMQDHMRVICCTKPNNPGCLGKAYAKMARFMNVFDNIFNCKRHPKLGFLTSRPWAIGNTLRFEVTVKLVGLTQKPEDLKYLCIVRGLRIQQTLHTNIVRLGNQQSLSIDELQTYQDFDRAIINVLTLEKELRLTNSLKIATVIAKIFKRKRLSRPRSIKT